MATYTELYNRCRRRLGRKSFDMSADFLDEMKAAQEQLERSPTLPTWLRTSEGVAAPVATSKGFCAPPAGMLKIVDGRGVYFVEDAAGTVHEATRLDSLEYLKSKENAGIPEGTIYYVAEKYTSPWSSASPWTFTFRPKQTVDVTIWFNFYEAQTVLTGANDNGWTLNEPELMLSIAGRHIAEGLRDDRALKYFMALEVQARADMLRRIEAEQWSDQDLTMGEPD